MARVKGSPAQERTYCPACGGKTLGNTYYARLSDGGPFAYKQCHKAGCGHIYRTGEAVPPPAKPDFPRNKRERAVFENYVNGCTGGALYAFVEMGKAGEPSPPRTESIQYAAWMAGRELARV